MKKNWKRNNDGQFEIQGQKERDLQTAERNLRTEREKPTNREKETYAQKGRLTYRMTNIESKQTERRVIKV